VDGARPITHTSAKQLVPVANKPVLFYGLEAMAATGIREVGIIVGDTAAEIQAAAGDGSAFGLRITYIPQPAPLGLAHAVLTAQDYLGDEPFVMYLGDNLLRDGITQFVRRFQETSPDALILLQHVDDPSAYGIAELDGDGRVARLVEKPPQPRSDLALVGVYIFTPAIFAAARAIRPSARGELEITDAIQHLLDGGLRVEPHLVSGWWKDTGKLDDILQANRLILSALEDVSDASAANGLPEGCVDCRIDGPVRIGAGSRLEHTTVRGPAVIGAGCRLTHAYIGPYTSLADNVCVEQAEIEHSIVLAGSSIHGLDARLTDSLIGRGVTIARSQQHPHACRFMVGDSSQIGVL